MQFHFISKLEDIPMNDPDFIVMFGNLLDNAIEAVEKCEIEKREIL